MLKAFSVKEQLIGEFPLNTAASEEPGQGELIFEHQVSERSKTVLGGGTRSRTHRHGGGGGGGGSQKQPPTKTHTQIYGHTHTHIENSHIAGDALLQEVPQQQLRAELKRSQRGK